MLIHRSIRTLSTGSSFSRTLSSRTYRKSLFVCPAEGRACTCELRARAYRISRNSRLKREEDLKHDSERSPEIVPRFIAISRQKASGHPSDLYIRRTANPRARVPDCRGHKSGVWDSRGWTKPSGSYVSKLYSFERTAVLEEIPSRDRGLPLEGTKFAGYKIRRVSAKRGENDRREQE